MLLSSDGFGLTSRVSRLLFLLSGPQTDGPARGFFLFKGSVFVFVFLAALSFWFEAAEAKEMEEVFPQEQLCLYKVHFKTPHYFHGGATSARAS